MTRGQGLAVASRLRVYGDGTVVAAAAGLKATGFSPRVDADVRVTALGAWGRGRPRSVRRVAFGEPDPISVGDHHLSRQIAFSLAGD